MRCWSRPRPAPRRYGPAVGSGELHLVPDGVEPGPLLPRLPGALRIRHVGWDLSSAGLRMLLDALHVVGPGARLHLVQPRSKPWDAAVQREVSAAARSGAVTSGPPGALPGSWADVEVLSGTGRDARAPAVLADALEAYARGRPVLAADSEAARADLPSGCTVFFPGADGEALGEALAALGSSTDLLAQSGAEARAYVERRHDGARVRGLLRDLYRGHGAAPASLAPGVGRVETFGAGRLEWDSRELPGERTPEGTDPGTPSRRVRVSSTPLMERRVLIVESQNDFALSMASVLRSAGYQTAMAEHRRRCAARAGEAPPGPGGAPRRAAGPVRVRRSVGRSRRASSGQNLPVLLLSSDVGRRRGCSSTPDAERRGRLPRHPLRDGRAGRR